MEIKKTETFYIDTEQVEAVIERIIARPEIIELIKNSILASYPQEAVVEEVRLECECNIEKESFIRAEGTKWSESTQ